MNPDLMTQSEVTEFFGMCTRTIRRWCEGNPEFPKPLRINRRVLFWRKSEAIPLHSALANLLQNVRSPSFAPEDAVLSAPPRLHLLKKDLAATGSPV